MKLDSDNKINGFFVGAPKCGTTTLYKYFEQCEEVSVPSTKEPHFFCTYFHVDSEKYSNVKYGYRNYEKYYALWQNKNRPVLADFSADYLYSKEAANNISRYNPNAKIIIIFREPVSFLWSWYKQALRSGFENKSFVKSLKLENARKQNEKLLPKGIFYPRQIFYSQWLQYSNQLSNYLNYFPKSQIRIFFYEDFKKDNQKVVDQISEFLNIKKFKIEQYEHNVGHIVKNIHLRYIFLNSYKIRKFARKILNDKILDKWSVFFEKLTVKPDNKTINPNIKKKLKKQYYFEVQKLNDLLHKHKLIDNNLDLIKFWNYNNLQ